MVDYYSLVSRGRYPSTFGHMRPNPYSGKQRAAKRAKRAAPRPQHAQLALIRSPVLNAEVKVAQVKIVNSTISATGTVLDCLGGMTQGTGMRNNFLGRKFQPIGISFMYAITQTPGNYTTNNRENPKIRVSLIQWEDISVIGTGPSITGIYEDQTTVFSPFELINWENIDTLHDTVHTPYCVASTSSTLQTGQTCFVKKYIKGKKLKPVLYNDVSASWQKGDIVLAYYMDSNLSPGCTLDGYVRVYFQDA